MLTSLINKHGSNVANDIVKTDDASGTAGVEKTIEIIDDTVNKAKELGISSENIAKMENQITKAASKGSKFTEPTLLKGGKPKGNYAVINPSDEIVNKNALNAQNRAEDVLAKNGYDITMLPDTVGGNGYGIKSTSSPDYLIDGKAFDCISPDTSNVRNVWSRVKLKTEEQATRIVINLDNYTGGTIDDIANQFLSWSSDMPNLEELILVVGDDIVRLIIK